ncbi:SGNH/GDSL hydrolase family protein [Planococcus halocryophilus]|uniref:SGNH/GDSL hydrolase family protein n=1 Tax=Planococcus halocryophilus TaxID=1215089 RepID=UPI001F0D0AE1|nr:SGNH/GDSL hydrolase family protein [Planococcus halocryophilus]MCH4826797.1 SGNH/GDSL hydrolase family protein [Planococcus halocryophilus]
MKLYKIGALLAVIICIIILFFSYLTWQDKLENVLAPVESVSAENDDQKEDKTEEVKSDKKVNIDALIANMDEPSQNLFVERNENGESLKVLIAGSAALESGDPGYAERLQASLEEAYADFIEVDILSIEGTSESLLDVDLSSGYDLVLLEPMTLMNNGIVAIEQEREHINEFRDKLTDQVEDAVLVLHPSQPIYGAGYYLAQIVALKEFAQLYDYAYINHWTSWPDTDNEVLKDHLTEDGLPNSKGAELWAEELEAYFIAN